MLRDTLREQQFTLARHLRDPADHPPPPGIEERRVRVYRELFFNNIEGLLASGFPVIHDILGEAKWKALVRTFYADHRSQTPLFTEIAAEFVAFVEPFVVAVVRSMVVVRGCPLVGSIMRIQRQSLADPATGAIEAISE